MVVRKLSENYDFIEEAYGCGELSFDFNIKEDKFTTLSEASTNVKHKYRIIGAAEGPFLVKNGTSRNNRFYPDELWEDVLSEIRLVRKIQSRQMLGTIGHHDKIVDDEDLAEGKVSHIVTYVDKETGIGRFEILDTPAGRLLKSYYESGIPLYVSSRAAGKLVNVQGYDVPWVDKSTYCVECWDIVKEPGFLEAKPEYIRLPEPLQEGISRREDVNPDQGKDKYGDVEFADEINYKYPIDTIEHVKSALSYWGNSKNREKYSQREQEIIHNKIQKARVKFGIDESYNYIEKEPIMQDETLKLFKELFIPVQESLDSVKVLVENIQTRIDEKDTSERALCESKISELNEKLAKLPPKLLENFDNFKIILKEEYEKMEKEKEEVEKECEEKNKKLEESSILVETLVKKIDEFSKLVESHKESFLKLEEDVEKEKSDGLREKEAHDLCKQHLTEALLKLDAYRINEEFDIKVDEALELLKTKSYESIKEEYEKEAREKEEKEAREKEEKEEEARRKLEESFSNSSDRDTNIAFKNRFKTDSMNEDHSHGKVGSDPILNKFFRNRFTK